MSEQTKITHIITGLKMGGAERSLHNLLSNKLGQSASHSVISLRDEGVYGPLLRDLGHEVHCLKLGHKTPGGLFRLRALMRQINPDLVQGWMYHGNIAARITQILGGAPRPQVWNIRQCLYDIRDEKLGTQWTIRFGAWQSAQSDKIIYNSRLAQTQHEAFGYAGQKSHLIPNGFDTAIWALDPDTRLRIRKEIGLPDTAKVIGIVGRNHPDKDLINFLRALQRSMSMDPDAHAVIVGRDCEPTRPDLQAHYAALDMDRVHILGQRSDIPAVMTGFDLLCLSSAAEAFPNVLGEAMASGLACVSTDVGDAAHVLDQAGILVPPRDSDALAQGLSQVLGLSPQERAQMGVRARKRIEANFSLTSTNDQYISLYENLLNRQL
ncbi:glycosyltransferase [Tropicibacter sp. Alg240-R139]|uniref:glycosyltransferase n=1 Tax=Tropicibacter sp. Alg240-R139 TaxID=2305991 RepID=UPI0013DFC8B7|nr:glycosyltransferase [Tropicibacter sp. Alg240-R139]